MLYCDVAGFFKSILQEEEEDKEEVIVFCGEGGGVFSLKTSQCKLRSRETATWLFKCLSWRGSSQLAECALSLVGFIGRSWAESMSCSTVYSLHLTFPLNHTYTQYTVQKSIIIILWRWLHSYVLKWNFYINHLSDILWDGCLYLAAVPCTV